MSADLTFPLYKYIKEGNIEAVKAVLKNTTSIEPNVRANSILVATRQIRNIEKILDVLDEQYIRRPPSPC